MVGDPEKLKAAQEEAAKKEENSHENKMQNGAGEFRWINFLGAFERKSPRGFSNYYSVFPYCI